MIIIRDQDGGVGKYIYVTPIVKKIIGVAPGTADIILGRYKTEERTMQVMVEIEKHIEYYILEKTIHKRA